MNLPDNLPPLPPVPEGFDRWEYRGPRWLAKNVKYAYLHESVMTWQVSRFHTTEASADHYLEAVREPAKCPECVEGYVQETGFDRCQECNPEDQPASGESLPPRVEHHLQWLESVRPGWAQEIRDCMATGVEARVCEASGVATWNPLDHGIQGAPLMVPAHEFNRVVSQLAERDEQLAAETRSWNELTNELAHMRVERLELRQQLAELTQRWEKAANAYLIERGQHEATQGQLAEARTALQLAAKLPTHQDCPLENHGIVVAAMEALARIDETTPTLPPSVGSGEGSQNFLA